MKLLFLLLILAPWHPQPDFPLEISEGMIEEGLIGDEEEAAKKPPPTAEDPLIGEFSRLGYFMLSVLIVGLIAWLLGAAPSRKKKSES